MNDKEMLIQHYLNQLKEQSKCIDKQVACVITDENHHIISTGINVIIDCDQNCNDKNNRVCHTIHAELTTLANLNIIGNKAKRPFYAYLNLFPCVPCQEALTRVGIKEIVVFGPQHKEQVFKNIRLEKDLYTELLDNNEEAKQLSVAQGELCELVTTISDYFYRGDKNLPIEELLDEIVDAELMINQIKLICWRRDHHIYNKLNAIRAVKYLKILKNAIEKVYRNK